MRKNLHQRLDQVDSKLAEYNQQLAEHMSRTQIMEDRFEVEKQYNHRALKELRESLNSLPVRTLQYLSIAAALFTFWKLLQ